ncbi:MAG: flagellar biosynthesis protein FlhA [Candidatus Wallbacteria bacterium]|nr:flagellar biosynthesis protein FlhA [Candidatus Wallbacteria bacterium]
MQERKFENTYLAAFLRNSDILISIGIVSIVVMMIIPLPSFLLDILIAMNISISMAILLVSMYLGNVLEFSVFPSLLLLITLFRLALNVSTTRLILLQGVAFNVKIVRAFGDFVVGGNYVVGIVIFIILVIIQFIVITRGATRVAEVAARFILDAMPGKQMSVDAELQNGLIDADQAREKRQNIKREADFYGAMDGASKFVQGDAIACILITVVNIIGGLIIGVFQRGEGIALAAQTYTLLTVGDGLVTMIPALLVSTATGLIVTRAASESNLGRDLISQFLVEPKVYFIIAALLATLGFTPGLPTLSFLMLALMAVSLGFALKRKKAEELWRPSEEETAKMNQEKKKKSEDVAALLQIEPLELELGYGLVPLFDVQSGGDLQDRVQTIRRNTALELGLIVPSVRIRDNINLEMNEYTIQIKGFEAGRGKLMLKQYLVMGLKESGNLIEGTEIKEPISGSRAVWVNEENREKAEQEGYTVLDVPAILTIHLTEVIRHFAFQILGQEELKDILKNLEKNYPSLIEEVRKTKAYEQGVLLKVLQNLLREGISIRNMVLILEGIMERCKSSATLFAGELTELCRIRMAPLITQKFARDGLVHVITLDPELEELFRNSLQGPDESDQHIALDSGTMKKIRSSMDKLFGSLSEKKISPCIILTSPDLRKMVKDLFDRLAPGIVVLSTLELQPNIEVNTLGMIEI